MSITTRPYGKDHHGNAVTEYTLTGATGASFSVLDFGATLTRVCMPDRAGKLGDVILGYDTAEEYTRNGGYLGASVGRFGNRIGGAAFDIEGRSYKLDKNDGENSLHGGFDGFSHRMWAVKTDEKNTSIEFALTSPDGDQGFPGKMDVTVTYTLDEHNALRIAYRAVTDKATLVNLTNHSYFNLDGCGTVEDHVLQLFAHATTEVGPGLIPTGRLIPLSEVPYGFTEPTRLGDVLAQTETDKDMKAAGGVDFNYCVGHDRETKLVAELYSPKTGRAMQVLTDLPGIQIYTGQGLKQTGKGGAQYGRFGGVAMETQRYPDGIHHAEFPSEVLQPGEVYLTATTYRFSVK